MDHRSSATGGCRSHTLRFADRPETGIIWQIMTQQVQPLTYYGIWIVGSNDGAGAVDFRWWVGSVRSSPRGDIDANGSVDVGVPLGPGDGLFANADAPLYLVITGSDGAPVQAACFPSP